MTNEAFDKYEHQRLAGLDSALLQHICEWMLDQKIEIRLEKEQPPFSASLTQVLAEIRRREEVNDE